MPIPLSPANISNAMPFPAVGNSALEFFTCRDPQEGPRHVPFQVNFINSAVWIIDVQIAAPQTQISQIAAVYVDATQSDHDINIIFEGGFQARIGFGTAELIPVISSVAVPKFYVILDDNGNASTTDICNIMVLNKFIPPASAGTLQSLSLGYTDFFESYPQFNKNTFFPGQKINPVNTNSLQFMQNAQCFLNSLDVGIAVNKNIGVNSKRMYDIVIEDGDPSLISQVIYRAPVFIRKVDLSTGFDDPYTQQVLSLPQLQYQSINPGGFFCYLDTDPATFDPSNDITVYINAGGGILIT